MAGDFVFDAIDGGVVGGGAAEDDASAICADVWSTVFCEGGRVVSGSVIVNRWMRLLPLSAT